MPSSVSEACTLLGWSDRIVDVTVLGTRLTVAAAIDQAEHADRLADGLYPVADPLLLKCVLHSDPGFATRRSPVRIDGAIAVRRRWSSARSALGTFTAFGSTPVTADAARAFPRVDCPAYPPTHLRYGRSW